MNPINKLIKKIFFSEFENFSQCLGFTTWNDLMDNSFHIFTIPPDAEWLATQLPTMKWAVWNDVGQPPFQYTEFTTWEEAIKYLRNIFEESEIPEENWDPEGFELNDDIFLILPDKKKRIVD